MSFYLGDLSMRKELKYIYPKIPADLSLVSPYLKDFHESVTAKKTQVLNFLITSTVSF